MVDISIPVRYDAGVVLSRWLCFLFNVWSHFHCTLEQMFDKGNAQMSCSLCRRQSNINFYVADAIVPVVTTVKSLDDIGPEFNFTVKVLWMNRFLKNVLGLFLIEIVFVIKCMNYNKLYFKVSTSNFPVSLLYLTIALPVTTKGGNQLLYVTSVDTQTVRNQEPATFERDLIHS